MKFKILNVYDELIISSGGNKFFSILGALNNFSKYYPLNKFKYLTGCSIGSIICLLLNINYSIDEINNILFKINLKNFQECKIINFIEKCGLDEGIKFTNFLKAVILNKNYNENITFKELYLITNKILTITVVNITKGITEYHNYKTTPNMSVILSTRMSANIPILFSPLIYNNNYYIDGALLEPFPYNYHKNTKKFGIWLFSKYEFDFLNKSDNVFFVDELTNSFKYMFDILKILYLNYLKEFYKSITNKVSKNIIFIEFEYNISIDNFDLTLEDKIYMFNIGATDTNIFLKKNYKRLRKKYLSFKYFYLWLKKIKN